MNLRSFSVTAVLASTTLLSSAYAADLPVYEPTPEEIPSLVNWTGFYVGIAGGGGIINHHTDVLGGVLSVDGFSGQGFLAEGTVGFDYQMGNFVLGALGDIHWSNLEAKASLTGLRFPPDIHASLELQWGFDVLGRAGVLLTPRSLLYVLGGYSWERFEGSASIDPFGNFGGLSVSDNEDTAGWTLGGGLEILVTNNLSVKGEYRYTGFGDFDFGTGGILSIEPHRQTARVGVNYKFGAPFGGPESGYTVAYQQGPANWTGFYLGLGAGGGMTNFDSDFFGGILNFDGFGGEGWLAEGTAGFDFQAGNFVLGALGNVNWSNIEASASAFGVFNASLQSQWGADALGRAGFLLTDRSLLYALGGWSWERYEGSGSAPFGSVSDTEDTSGPTVGAGVEVLVTNNLSVKGEYRYTKFDSFDFGTGGLVDIEPERQTARFGVNYKFGGIGGH